MDINEEVLDENLSILKDARELLSKIETMLCEVKTVKNAKFKETLDFHVGQAWYSAHQLIELTEEELENFG